MSSGPDPRVLDEAAEMLSECTEPVAFTGAGMSKESGIRTFRGEDGYWREYRAEELATPAALAEDPRLVWEWYRERLMHTSRVEPHPGYLALVELERRFGRLPVITQNVDGLHHRAGSSEVIELHGSMRTASCMKHRERRHQLTPELVADIPPTCECGAVLRPDVVLFGEMLPQREMARAFECADSCDVMLVVGTSMVVFPAAAMPYRALAGGAGIIEINPNETELSGEERVVGLRGSAGTVLPELLERLES